LLSVGPPAQQISSAYSALYKERHDRRLQDARAAIEQIKGRAEWGSLVELTRTQVIQPLVQRCCERLDLPPGCLVCRHCRATIGQMDSETLAIERMKAEALTQLQILSSPPQTPVKRVRVVEFLGGSLDSEAAIDEAVNRLREHLLKLVQEGVKIVLE
jgi:hypothetical protein